MLALLDEKIWYAYYFAEAGRIGRVRMPYHVLYPSQLACLLYTHDYDKLYTLQLLCKGVKMRTNIVLDDALVKRAQQLTGIRTKREVVDTALRTLVRLHEQSLARTLRGKLHWEGNLEELRQGRTHAGG